MCGAESLQGVDGKALACRKDGLGVEAAGARARKKTRPRALAHAGPLRGRTSRSAILSAFGYYTACHVAVRSDAAVCMEPSVLGSDKYAVHINLRKCASLDQA